MSLAILDARSGPITILQLGENTAEASRHAAIAVASADAAAASAHFYATRAEAVAALAVGAYFTSAETGTLRMYQRTGTTPFYTDQGNAAAPFGRGSLDTDGTFAANSDVVVPTQKAVKTYVDSRAAKAIIGAKGDGATNNTAAFLAAAAVGGVYFVPDGTYMIDYITVDKPLHLILSTGATIKNRIPSSPATTLDAHWGLFRFVAGSEGSVIEGGTLDGNRAALAPYYVGHTRLGQDNHWWGVRTELVDDITIARTQFRNFMSEAFYAYGGQRFRALDVDIADCGVAFAVQGPNDLGTGCVIRASARNIGNVVSGTAYYLFQHGVTFGSLTGAKLDLTIEGFCASKQGVDGVSTGGGKEPVPIAVNLYLLENSELNCAVRGYTTPAGLTSAHQAFNWSSVNNCSGLLSAYGLEQGLAASSSNGNTFNLNFDGDWINAGGYPRQGLLVTHGGVFPANVAGLSGETGSNLSSRDNVFSGAISRFGVGVRDEGEANDYSALSVYGNVTDGIQLVVASGTSASYPVARRRPSGNRVLIGTRVTTNGEAGVIYTGGDNDTIIGCHLRDNGQTFGTRVLPYNLAIYADSGEGKGVRAVNNDVDATASATITNEVSFAPGTATAKPANCTYSSGTALTHIYPVIVRNSNHYRIGEIIRLKGVLSGGLDADGKVIDIDQDIVTLAFASAVVFDAAGVLDTLTGTGSTSGTALTGVGTLFTSQVDFPAYLKKGSEYRRIVYVTSNTSAIIESPFSTNLAPGSTLQIVRADVQTGIVNPQFGAYVNGNVTTGPLLLRDNAAQNIASSVNYASFPGLDRGSRFEADYSLTMAGTTLDNVIVTGLPQWASVVNTRVTFTTAITGLTGSVSLVLKDNGTTINTPISTWTGFTLGTVHRGPSPEAPAFRSSSGSVNFVSGSGNPSGTITVRCTIEKWAF